jgi:hypothetical protein
METLEKLFYDTKTGFRPSTLYSRAKAINSNITRAVVKRFLDQQTVSQVFKPRKIKSFYPLIAMKPGRIQIDLMDFSNEDTVTNKNRKWLFCAVDVFSRYAFCYPQISKSESNCLTSLNQLIRDCRSVGITVYQIDSDSESAFTSRSFKSVLKEHQILQNLVPVGDKHRVGIVERFNGTVRQYLNRYKTAYKTTDWLSVIPDFVENYNTSRHSALDTQTPLEAITGTGATKYMFDQTIDAGDKDYNKVQFSVGDKVRLRKKYSLFEKRSDGVWTRTIHTIEEIKRNEIYVNDRTEPYSRENLLNVNSGSMDVEVDERKAEEEEKIHKNQKIEKRITRSITKEGIDRERDIVTDIDAKVLRRYRKERDHGFMILS